MLVTGSNRFETRTDAEGLYLLEGLPAGEGYRLIFQAPGFVTQAFGGNERRPREPEPLLKPLSEGERAEFSVALSRGWGIVLTVRGPDGKLLREASALLTTGAGDPEVRNRGVIGLSLVRKDDVFEALGMDLQAYPPAGATVTVSAPGARPSAPVPLATAPCVEGRYLLDVTLQPGRIVVGMVLGADGAGVPKARVICWPSDLCLTAASFASEVQEVQAREDGGFQIEGLPSGRALSFWAQGPRAAMKAPLEIPGGNASASATLRLDADGEISGRVLDEQGRPVPGAAVRAEYTLETDFGFRRDAVTDAEDVTR